MAEIPVCPIMSVRNSTTDELCLQQDCALYLAPAKKCSLLFIGWKAMVDIQQQQQQAKG